MKKKKKNQPLRTTNLLLEDFGLLLYEYETECQHTNLIKTNQKKVDEEKRTHLLNRNILSTLSYVSFQPPAGLVS